MPFYLNASHSSRVTKPRAPLRRTSSSPFSSFPRKKSTSELSNKDKKIDNLFQNGTTASAPLQDLGNVATLPTERPLANTVQFVEYIHERMFEDIPERAGMNSTRIAEVLNFRKNLPPIVTRTHIHALTRSPTSIERETAQLIRSGAVRKLDIPGRGKGASAVGECLVLTNHWAGLVEQSDLPETIKDRYVSLLRTNKGSMVIDAVAFSQQDTASLTQNGFLTSVSALNADVLLRPGSATLGTLTSLASVGSRSASGSVAAVGGQGAIHDVGGEGSALSAGEQRRAGASSWSSTSGLNLSLPSIGLYLRLICSAREHLIALLAKSQYGEAPIDLLRERWDGGVDSAGSKKQSVGLKGNVLPGKTKKWRQFYGLRFHWILEECLGAGLIEVFQTGSVGLGVRVCS